MLRVYHQKGRQLVPSDLEIASESPPPDANGALWLDLINPARQEAQYVERVLGVSVPTREEAQDIEISARLYHEDGAEFMTMTGVSQLDTDTPSTTPITFVLKDQTLATIRYAQPRPFNTYAARAQKANAVP